MTHLICSTRCMFLLSFCMHALLAPPCQHSRHPSCAAEHSLSCCMQLLKQKFQRLKCLGLQTASTEPADAMPAHLHLLLPQGPACFCSFNVLPADAAGRHLECVPLKGRQGPALSC